MRTMVTTTSTSNRQTAGLTSHPPRGFEDLYTRPRLQALLERERARTDRNGGQFSVVLFRVKDSNLRTLSTARLARTVLGRARFTDDVGWFSDRFLGAILPDTSTTGAWRFAQDVRELVAGKAPRPLCLVYTYPSQPLPEDGNGQDRGRSEGHRPAGAGGLDRLGETADDGNGTNHAHGNGHANGNGHATGHGHEVGGHGPDAPHRAGSAGGQRGDPTAHATLLLSLAQGLEAELGSQPLEQFLAYPMPRWKRWLDLAVSSVLLLLLSPVMLAIAVAVRLSSPGPALFKQRRAGLGGRPFTIYKFRTMTVDAEARKQELRPYSQQDGPAFKMADDPRVTSIGRILRKASLDELPQLWNVLKGDMSLVGPRPLPCEESDSCQQWHRRRLDVTPGLTCVWQVSGRSCVSFAQWMRMDMQYIRRRSLLMDLKLILLTVPALVLKQGR